MAPAVKYYWYKPTNAIGIMCSYYLQEIFRKKLGNTTNNAICGHLFLNLLLLNCKKFSYLLQGV